VFDDPVGQCLGQYGEGSVFSSLKTERVRRHVYRTRDAARAAVFDYIERFENMTRRHSTIGYRTSLSSSDKREALA
jgi:putative transposase